MQGLALALADAYEVLRDTAMTDPKVRERVRSGDTRPPPLTVQRSRGRPLEGNPQPIRESPCLQENR